MTDPSDEELRRLDAEAVRLTRHRNRERLGLGDAMFALGKGFEELGFRNFAAYVRERTSLGARWCVDTRALSRRTAELPSIRGALWSHRLTWSMAELLSRHAVADDEQELLEACAGETIRAVRRILKERGEEPEPEPGVEERFVTLDLTMPVEDAIGLEVSRRQVDHVNGGPGEPGSWLECLLFEAHTTLLATAPEAFDRSEDVVAELRGWVEARRLAEARNVDAEERARPEPLPSPDGMDDDERDDAGTLPSDPVALDRIIRERAKRIASGDVWLGRILDRLFRARAWKRLGYATETQYAQDRFGMSRSAVRQRIRLTRKARWLDGLDDAIQRGALGQSHASAIARVATPDTLSAWIERASRRTYKHLLEEVQLVELCMRVCPDDGEPILPPSEDDMDEWHRIEADWLSGAFLQRWAAEVETVSAPATMLEGADGEPYRQYGDHIDALEDALAALQPPASESEPKGASSTATSTTNPHPPRVQTSAPFASAATTDTEGHAPSAVQMSVPPESATTDTEARAPAAVQMSVLPESVSSESAAEAAPPVRMSVSESAALVRQARRRARRRGSNRTRATATAQIVVREEVRLFYRELEAVFERSGLPGSFIELLLVDFWQSWAHLFEVGNKHKHLHDRDRHRCACPVCFVQKSLSNHHLRYRAHGGGDEPSNQIIACDFCHLDGEHGGRLRVRGTAERPVWILGRVPILRIEGREKIELNDGRSRAA